MEMPSELPEDILVRRTGYLTIFFHHPAVLRHGSAMDRMRKSDHVQCLMFK